jgi:hypothetical protein
VGALRRAWESISASLELSASPVGDRIWRVRVEVSNQTPWQGMERQDAQRRSLLSTHLVLRVTGGQGFLSLADPPRAAADAAATCCNAGVWPVLVGEPGARDAVLASPIVLEDHPRVAAESPGDLFDGGEIDQLLRLNILALTDAEKSEMAASDPAARLILERTESLDREALARLHGTFRGPREEAPQGGGASEGVE